jgi:hypothetical protein
MELLMSKSQGSLCSRIIFVQPKVCLDPDVRASPTDYSYFTLKIYSHHY